MFAIFLSIFYRSFPIKSHTVRTHRLFIDKRNSVANTEELINMIMINGDSLIEAKQHLGKVLALVEAAELPGSERDVECGNCYAAQSWNDERMVFIMNVPDWSDCAGCVLK